MTDEEIEAVYLYAEAWNRLDSSIVQSRLASDVRYSSQNVFEELEGQKEVARYIDRKMNTIRQSPESKVFAEVAFYGDQESQNLQGANRSKKKPCVLMAQGETDNVVGVVLLTMNNEKVQQIDLCTVAPRPSDATRTGKYPGREE